ncbi:unnamed protein product [marine sediment metagenome]|uniref:Uncharacterized protein n=1 Tax=marine sediment metagenome TaxID=412755 RepID=X1HD07_9ZZZZ
MPSRVIIDGFKGKIDFYLYLGIPVARKWPVWKKRESTPEEKAGQDDFKLINQIAITLPVEIISAYREMATSTPFTWKDLLVRGYMRGLWL